MPRPTAALELFARSPSLTLLRTMPHRSFLRFAPDGAHYLTVGAVDTRLCDLATGDVERRFETAQGQFDAALSPDGARIAIWEYEFRVVVYEVATKKELGRVEGLRSQFGQVCWTRDGSRVAIVAHQFHGDAPIVVLTRDGERRSDVAVHVDPYHPVVAYGPTSIATLDLDHGVVIVDLATGASHAESPGHTSGQFAALSPDGLLAVSRGPTMVTLSRLPGSKAALPAQAALHAGTDERLQAQLARHEARLEKTRARAARLDREECIADVQALRKGLPPDPLGRVFWASGAGGQSMSRGGLKGLAFTATPSELVVAGHQDLVRARWSEAGVAEELLLSALPQHGPLALLERLEASGDVVALRLESQLRGVDSQDCLFRLAPGFTPVTAPTSKAKVRATPKARRSTTR